MTKKHFTLSELIIVIVVMGILASIVMVNLADGKKDAIVAMMESNIRNVQTAIDTYQLKHEGEFPVAVQPTLGKPSKIDFGLLYPDYLRSLPNEDRVPNQKYWVDVYGKVWGSTVDAPDSFFEQGKFIEWISNEKTSSYYYYEVKPQNTSSKAFNVNISSPKEIINKGLSRIQIPKPNHTYLVSSVDEYGLETAPVGPNYQGMAEDWFTPILMKEGTFFIEFGGSQTMYWDRFWTLEDKPEGSDIKYRFTVQDENGNWINYTDDFYSLQPSKRIKIEITMIGSGKNKPSVLDMRVDFHFEGEDVEIPSLLSPEDYPINLPVGSPSSEVYTTTTPTGKSVVSINAPYGNDINILTPNSGGSSSDAFVEIPSIQNIQSNQPIYIVTSGDKSVTGGYGESFNKPTIKYSTSSIPVKVFNPYENKLSPEFDGFISLPEMNDINWTTVDGFNLFFFGGAVDEVNWINSVIEDKKPEHTRILYYYTPSTEDGWGNRYERIEDVPNSRAIKVTVILQVDTFYYNKVAEPEFISMIINSDSGFVSPSSNSSKQEDFLAIYPKKITDTTLNGFFTTSQIEWDYMYQNKSGATVLETEWRGDKQNQYSISGDYQVELRVKNSKGSWSQWVSYTINIQEPNSKPTVAIVYSPNTTIDTTTNITWSYQFNDADKDTLSKLEWKVNGVIMSQPPTRFSSTGTYKVELRVQDSRGSWSDTAVKTINVAVPPKLVLTGGSTSPYTATNSQPSYISWTGDMTGKRIALTIEVLGYYDSTRGYAVFEGAGGTILSVSKYDKIGSATVSVPSGATRIRVYLNTSGGHVNIKNASIVN